MSCNAIALSLHTSFVAPGVSRGRIRRGTDAMATAVPPPADHPAPSFAHARDLVGHAQAVSAARFRRVLYTGPHTTAFAW